MIKDKVLNTRSLQSEQVYMEYNCIYYFDRQKMFRVGYIAGKKGSSQMHKR